MTELGAMALPSWRRSSDFPSGANAASYEINDLIQHRQTREANLTPSASGNRPPRPSFQVGSSSNAAYGAIGGDVFWAPDSPALIRAARDLSTEVLMEIARERIDLQNSSGEPLPSGKSFESRGTRSTYPSSYSSAFGQYRAPSPADSSMCPSTTLDFDRSQGKVQERAAAPYTSASQASGSSPITSVKPIHCKHKPGNVVDTETFVGCDVTDDELKGRDRKAEARVWRRKTIYKKAERLGLATTGEANRVEKDARAAARGFTSRQKAERAEKDERAFAKGFSNQHEAELAGRRRTSRGQRVHKPTRC